MNTQEKNLSFFLAHLLESICRFLHVDTEMVLSSEIEKDNSLHGLDRGLAICEIFQADTYINAIGGQTLYSKDDFLAKNIELLFIKTNNIVYQQFNCEFVPSLSIIDVLMFNSVGRIHEMLSEYELI